MVIGLSDLRDIQGVMDVSERFQPDFWNVSLAKYECVLGDISLFESRYQDERRADNGPNATCSRQTIKRALAGFCEKFTFLDSARFMNALLLPQMIGG